MQNTRERDFLLVNKMAAPSIGAEMSVDLAISLVLNDLGITYALKDEQITAIKAILNKNDTLAVLPTGKAYPT